jgi:hypothetical protein
MRHSPVRFLAPWTIVGILMISPLPAQAQSSAKVPDLSGAWRGQPLMSVSTADPGGQRRGKEPDIPYQPWALEKMLAEVPPTGPAGEPHRTTDPWIRYCEPNGPIRIYAHPGRTSFVQLPDKVLILHEVMQQFRIVRLNSSHPPLDDLDPSSWGDSIGWYENGETLVVDTIGKPFSLKRTFMRSNVPFMQSPWNCSVRDNQKFTEGLLDTAAVP